jgi:hypothetical protein
MADSLFDDNPKKDPITGLFADLRTADMAARGLIALGLTEKQVQILDLPRLILEYNPELVDQITRDETTTVLTEIDEELLEGLGLRVVEEVDVPRYLEELGLREHKARYFANKIRSGYVVLVADSDENHLDSATKLMDEMGLKT